MNIYKTFDVVVVPFPFVDSLKSKNRPALVISSEKHFNGPTSHTVLAMITSAMHSSWPLDVPIGNVKSCGLEKPSIIRLKLFTLDNRLIKKRIGKLSSKDQESLQENMALAFENLIYFQ
jgi:mRNA interferase MazF